MRKKRSIGFRLFVLFWSLLFFGGVYIVFLFLNGYSFFETRVLKKGYVYFSSESPLFLNGKYLHKNDFYGQREVGKYVLCVDDFSKESQCYGHVEVGENDKVSQSLRDLYAVAVSERARVFPLSNKGDTVVFSPNEQAVVWYDKKLKEVFFVESADGKITSRFLGFEVGAIVFDTERNGFIVKRKNGGKEEVFLSVSGKDTPFLYLSKNAADFRFLDFRYEKHFPSESFFEKTIAYSRGVFALPLYSQCSVGKGRHVLFFDNSVYLFLEQMEHFSFFSRKDNNTQVLCDAKREAVYFMKDGVLVKGVL